MIQFSSARLDQALKALPHQYSGPGGAVAVLREGEVLARHSWGWADIERRIPFTPQTLSLICSISKQFTCAVLLDQFADPSVLDEDIRGRLPNLRQAAPAIRDLCHNQSGLRDYWALAMLAGSPIEGKFGEDQAQRLIGRTQTLHFQPGTRYSYCNQNFRLLSDMIEHRTGRSFAELLRQRIFDRADMPHAILNPDTAYVRGGTIGYEGTVESGFRPAVNNIYWTGDAGIAASLDDMIAWERFIDSTRDETDGLYSRLSAPPQFRDGSPAFYGYGLNHSPLCGLRATSHGGGLRGWRSFRLNVPELRVSIVVLFNHMADPRAAALELLAALLDQKAAEPVMPPAPAWIGQYHEPETGLAVRIETTPDSRLRLHYAPGPEMLSPTADGTWSGASTRLRPTQDGLWMDRQTDHQSTRLVASSGEAPAEIEGRFHCAELNSDFTCVSAGGVLYGAFSGELGQGAMQPLIPFDADRWLFPCPRALDHSPPGDWTLQLVRNEGGEATGLRAGCWLARDIPYMRVQET
jgi:D-aminopeptidase